MAEKELNIQDILKSIEKTKASIDQLLISQAQTDEQMKKTDEQMKKTDAKLERIGIKVGNISNNQGDITEEFFYNSFADKLILGGIAYDFIKKNDHKRLGNIEDEYDMLLVNGKDVAIVEVKYKLHNSDINKLLEKKYTNFKKLYPEYKDYNHHLVLASFYVNDALKNKALDNNITILQRKGDVFETSLPKH